MTRCYQCMRKLEGQQNKCPECGYIDMGTDNASHLIPGMVLNKRYLIGNSIGQGGFGITYIGYDYKLEVRVAIKEYYPISVSTRDTEKKTVRSISSDKNGYYKYGLEKFIGEAKVLAKFNQQANIVSVIDYFKANGTAYIVMEYLEGVSLNEYLDNHGEKLSVEKSLDIIIPTLTGLAAIHNEGLIHRDISPDNIFITKNNEVKLLDLGAARYAFNEKSSDLTVILKRGYAPPEQYSRKGNQGPWTDVYALGATWYKLLTGIDMIEALSRSVGEVYKKPSELGVEIKPELEAVLEKSLAYQQNNRYQDVQEFKTDLENTIQVKAEDSDKTEIIFEDNISTKDSHKKTHPNKRLQPWIIVSFTIGFVVASCLVFVIGVLGKNEEINLMQEQLEQTNQNLKLAMEDYNTEKASLESVTLTLAEVEAKNAMSQEELSEVNSILMALHEYFSGNTSIAANNLYNINEEHINNADILTIYDEIKILVYSEVVAEYYDLGYELQGEYDYEAAAVALEVATKFLPEVLNVTNSDGTTYEELYRARAYYYLGKSYYYTQRYELSKTNFEVVYNDYPDHYLNDDAAWFIGEILDTN